MRGHQTRFFTTREDLAAGIAAAEAAAPLSYTLCGLFDAIPVPRPSLLDWSLLGQSKTGDHVSGPSWLVTKRDMKVAVEEVPQLHGGTKFNVGQSANVDSVVLQPNGVFDAAAKVIVCGQLGTASNTKAAVDLYKTLKRALTGKFTRHGSYWIGPEAQGLLVSGWRFVTISVASPTAYDLR